MYTVIKSFYYAKTWLWIILLGSAAALTNQEINMSIKITPIKPITVIIPIIGMSPIIQHKWTEKALRMLRMTPAERKKQPKVARDPEAEGEAAAHRMADGSYALPLMAFKAALITAAHKDIGLEKTLVRKSIFIPDKGDDLLTPLYSDEPFIREDIVKIGTNQTDIRYRPEFRNWSADIEMEVETSVLTIEDVVNLVNRAGFGVGIGEWRPEKGGEFGRFMVDTSKEIRHT